MTPLTLAERRLLARRILGAFDSLSADARVVLGEALEINRTPFLSSLGSALASGPQFAELVVGRALSSALWNGSAILLERLSDNEPWATVRECLAEALGDQHHQPTESE